MIVVASAIVASSSGPTIAPDPAYAEAESSWGVSVGFAFSFEQTPTVLYPAPVEAQSLVTGSVGVGVDYSTLFAEAVVQQSEVVAPPPPSGQQITFHWSM